MDADELVGIVLRSIDEIHARGVKPCAVAVDTFWHNLVGVDETGKAVTPVFHPFDSRSVGAAAELAKRIDNARQQLRTGCMLHPSYPPAKLLWLSQTQPDRFRAAKRWLSIGEYLFLKLFGKAPASTSMISATGLWDQNLSRYDEEVFSALPVERDQFASVDNLDEPCTGLLPEFQQRWPELNGIPWYPALGDGACDNVGSGCATKDRWALMVGTSGALRAAVETDRLQIAPGLFCYRIDRKRFVTGGALSNGGEVYAWMKRNLQLPDDAEIEKQMAALQPGLHGITMLPLFAGERSPEWRTDVRGAMTGLSSSTTAIEILHAALESVSLRFRQIFDIMCSTLERPKDIVGSGGGLLHSPAWTRMMADALAQAVVLCPEKEATARGAALLALERLGKVRSVNDFVPQLGQRTEPDPARAAVYAEALQKQKSLYKQLFEEKS